MVTQHESNLAARIEDLVVPPGQLALWALGQAGFVIKGGDTIAYIDPYLSNLVEESGGPARRFPAPLEAAGVRHAQVVFATHEHLDHTDVPTLAALMQASAQATLITSPQGRELALQGGVPAERIIVPRVGERGEIAGLVYTPIPAAHGASALPVATYAYEVDEQGQARWMGFLIELNGVTLYHSGDTILVPEMLAALQGRRIDLALLPINGRDFFREQQDLVGNLLPAEAVQFAVAIGARVLIGMHNDLFEGNRVDPGLLFSELDRLAPWQRCHILQPGELYLYAG